MERKELTRKELCANIKEAEMAFSCHGIWKSCAPYGNGHINDTFLCVTAEGRRLILQRINHAVFKKPEAIMENICRVTDHIRGKVPADGDVARATLTVLPTTDGHAYFRDGIGSYWRLYDFVEGTVTRERAESIREFSACAEAFGRFGGVLADFPAHTLYEAIPHFHDTPARFRALMEAVERDPVGRVASVQREIDFVKERESFASVLENAHATGALPLRVTHNDTKLNNILFDEVTHLPVCVIDLDTVMPGYSVNDFGDSIRFGANTAAEDETDLSRVSLDLSLYDAYREGFLRGCDGALNREEIALLPVGARMMTFECGMRFLTDYIEGDTYFRIARPEHNLDRCRCQFALLSDMERKL